MRVPLGVRLLLENKGLVTIQRWALDAIATAPHTSPQQDGGTC